MFIVIRLMGLTWVLTLGCCSSSCSCYQAIDSRYAVSRFLELLGVFACASVMLIASVIVSWFALS